MVQTWYTWQTKHNLFIGKLLDLKVLLHVDWVIVSQVHIIDPDRVSRGTTGTLAQIIITMIAELNHLRETYCM